MYYIEIWHLHTLWNDHHNRSNNYLLPAAAKSLQSCPTLCDPMDCSLPGSSICGNFQARVLEWGAIAFCNNYLPPYKVIMILLTIFLLLYITSLRLIYFITEVLYFLIPFIYFIQLPTPPLWQPFICSLYLRVCFHFVFFVLFLYFPHISEIIEYLYFSAWFISLRIIHSSSISVFTSGKNSFFVA